MKTLLIRTEANEDVALGHFKRCLSIALAYKKYGGNIILICDEDEYIRATLKQHNISYFPTRIKIGTDRDAQLLLKTIASYKISLLLLDSYNYHESFLKDLYQNSPVKFALLDDIADRTVRAHCVINGNAIAPQLEHKYQAEKKLLGPNYTPLSSEYWEIEKHHPKEEITDIMITLGGIDHYKITEQSLLILQEHISRLNIHIVIGPYYDNLQSIQNIASQNRHNVLFHKNPNGIAKIIKQSDLAISAGGQTLYELAAFGCPTIGISLWPNQELNVRALEIHNAIIAIYYEKTSIKDKLQQALQVLLSDQALRSITMTAAGKIIDGHGALRVAKELYNLG